MSPIEVGKIYRCYETDNNGLPNMSAYTLIRFNESLPDGLCTVPNPCTGFILFFDELIEILPDGSESPAIVPFWIDPTPIEWENKL